MNEKKVEKIAEHAHLNINKPLAVSPISVADEAHAQEVGLGVTEISIKGMACASCVRRIENSLLKVEGVEKASVSLAGGLAFVESQANVSSTGMVKAVEKAGYQAQIVSDSTRDEHLSSHETGTHHSDHNVHSHHHEHSDSNLTGIKFWLMIIISAVVIGLGMWMHHPPIVGDILLIGSALVVFGFGAKIFQGAFSELRNFAPGMDTLIALGASAAFVAGLVEWVNHPSGALDFEAAAAIMAFQLIGRKLEDRARRSMTSGIDALLRRSPKTAQIIEADGSDRQIEIEKLNPGDRIRSRSGDAIAADGWVREGESTVDESMLTGESIPVLKKLGDKVFQGTLVNEGSLVIEVEKAQKGATLDRIAHAVKRAQASKAPSQRLADTLIIWFVPIVVILAIAAAVISIVRGDPWHAAIMNAISVVVVSCPCALGLAIPAAISVASSKGSALGILYKDAESIEASASIDAVIFDKTGTLTTGKPVVSSVQLSNEFCSNLTTDDLINLAAAAESGSNHPIAFAIKNRATKSLKLVSYISHIGKGIEASVQDNVSGLRHQLLVGTKGFVQAHLSEGNESEIEEVSSKDSKSQIITYVAIDGKFAGIIAMEDEIKNEATTALSWLKHNGIHTEMVTGDQLNVAATVAGKLNLDHFQAEISPEGKVDAVHQIRGKGKVAMVGDGINDAPALAAANLGIAIGSGTDVAIGSASVTVLGEGLANVVNVFRLGKAAKATIHQNLFWAIGYNVTMIPIAMFGKLDPMWSSAAMAVSSLCVVLNSLRLNLFKSHL